MKIRWLGLLLATVLLATRGFAAAASADRGKELVIEISVPAPVSEVWTA